MHSKEAIWNILWGHGLKCQVTTFLASGALKYGRVKITRSFQVGKGQWGKCWAQCCRKLTMLSTIREKLWDTHLEALVQSYQNYIILRWQSGPLPPCIESSLCNKDQKVVRVVPPPHLDASDFLDILIWVPSWIWCRDCSCCVDGGSLSHGWWSNSFLIRDWTSAYSTADHKASMTYLWIWCCCLSNKQSLSECSQLELLGNYYCDLTLMWHSLGQLIYKKVQGGLVKKHGLQCVRHTDVTQLCVSILFDPDS